MKNLATAEQHQDIQRIALDKNYTDAQEFVAFNAPELFGYQRSLAKLTEEEARELIRRGK